MQEIYEFVTSRGVLSDKHSELLKTKRGFTEQTIKRNRFFSAGQYLLSLEKELTEKFKPEDLIESGVFLRKKESIHLDPILLQDHIVIPYLDKGGKARLIRPHKLGLKKVPVQIYQPFNIHGENLIITEGEFKAAAACQLTASCIALPGIASFSGEHYKTLIEFLNENSIKNICIIFDNEVKDDPKLPKYKPDAMDRYDTQYYSYLMAKMLTKDGFNTHIGLLPDSWRVDGKVDIDGALAQGKTKSDFDGIVRRSIGFKEYYDSLEDEAKEVIRKKEAKRFFRTHIRVDFNKYIAKRWNGKREWDEDISNFTMKIIATHETAEGIIREIKFVNEFGKSAPFFAIKPEDMMGNDSFSTFCARHGNFIWKGRKEDLYAIWEHEFLNDSGRHIIEPDCIGWLPENKLWVFGNVAFMDDLELRPDDHGIFWTEKRGFKPIPLGVSSGKNVISEGIPYLTLNKCDFGLLRSKLSESIGNYEAMVCLGWSFSVLFMEYVFRKYGCFPFLFITGRRRSGKSTVAEWIMNFFGLENSGKQAGDTTSVAMQRYMSYYSSLPFFVDEYRNDQKVTSKNGLLRNAYNRQSAGKGMKSDFGIREAKVRGTLIIAGEETPNDNALLTRCVVILVSEMRRKINNFDWFVKNRAKLSSFSYDILSNQKLYLDKYLIRLEQDKNEIAQTMNDDRLAINMAVISAGAWSLFGEDKSFASMFVRELNTTKKDLEEESIVSSFFNDVKAMAVDPQNHLKELWDVQDGKIYLYFHAIYNKWSKDFQGRNKETPFKSEAIRNYLKDEPGFIDIGTRHRMKSGQNRCVVFDLESAPDFIRDLVDDGGVTHQGVTDEQGVTTNVTAKQLEF